MSQKIKGLFLLICAVGVLGLAMSFFSRGTPIEVQVPMVTKQMVEEKQAQLKSEAEQRQNAEAARKRAETEARVRQCTADEQCIIVDRDPCGCFKGPEGVTAINSVMSLEFSQMVQAETSGSTVCPEVGSSERECSATAQAVCRQNSCTIIY